eukprot:c25883_g1_i1 orf=681-1436(-)
MGDSLPSTTNLSRQQFRRIAMVGEGSSFSTVLSLPPSLLLRIRSSSSSSSYRARILCGNGAIVDGLGRAPGKRSRWMLAGRCLLLCSSMKQGWQEEWRSRAKAFTHVVNLRCNRQNAHRSPLVVDEFGGQYEENFEDVQKHLLDYFTYKAVKTVLAQLHEMHPMQYSWFYNFVVHNKPQDSKYFLRVLVKERQELGERVMVTRLHLFNKWVKKYNHTNVHNAISDQNLELLRERLIETVKWPSDADDKKEI